MPLEQHLEQTQKLCLSQFMQQSLLCLQMPVHELGLFLREAAISNPMLEVEDLPLGSPYPEPETAVDVEVRDGNIWEGRSSAGGSPDAPDFTAMFTKPPTFCECVCEQLRQRKDLVGEFLGLCLYLVGCLNSMGYLDCTLAELSEETGCSLFDLEQALFVVQSLDPAGVGARNLSECLILQLARGREFNELNIHMVSLGLPLLAKEDYPGLAKVLGSTIAKVRQSAEVIRSLEPIPSRGFSSGNPAGYIIPEAVVKSEYGQLVVEFNRAAMPDVTLNADYCAMLSKEDCAEAQPYLREKLAEAREIISSVQGRNKTLTRLLTEVVRQQKKYFLSGGPLRPMTMRQMAELLELSTSTVSRAVKGKYLQCNGRVIELKSLFTTALLATDGEKVSAEMARQQISMFISKEDPAHPLSDKAVEEALAGVGVLLSRRTVAKYRGQLGIPAAAERKRKNEGR